MIKLVGFPLADGFFEAVFVKDDRGSLFTKRERFEVAGKLVEKEGEAPEIIFAKKAEVEKVGEEFAKKAILDYLGW